MKTPNMDRLLADDPDFVAAIYDRMLHYFGKEWLALTSHDRVRVTEDYLQASLQDDCNLSVYRKLIGEGNLASYAECLKIQAAKEEDS